MTPRPPGAEPGGEATPSEAILDVRGLGKSFGAVTAAKDITLAVGAGAVVGIIGTNGAGKTTFVNMITGWLTPSTGSIAFRGRRIDGRPVRELARLGIARSFQVPQLFETATLLENVVLSLATADAAGAFADPWTEVRVAEAEAILARYRIDAFAARTVGKLPQGVRKLADIAMAMARRPALLLLDEPTSGVSVDEKFEAMDIVMGALDADEVTILFVEHDMDVVERYARRVLAFVEGRVIADGDVRDVLAHPTVAATIVGEGRVGRAEEAAGMRPETWTPDLGRSSESVDA